MAVLSASLLLTHAPADAARKKRKADAEHRAGVSAAAVPGAAEARLIEIYRLIGQARTREALARAEQLVREHPNFQLAQLVHGDLLSSLTRPVRTLGDVPDSTARANAQTLAELREESAQRLRALRERPPAGAIPSPFLALPPRHRHAIAIDASRSRLYLFENGAHGMKLVADYYISVGKSGVDKTVEGDARTPLGVYFITSRLDPKTLRDFYGSGALPINYPNAWDLRRGRTGSGIWLHGTPPNQFARAPRASDGCVVLANPDLEHVMATVETRTTPVVIAQQLDWVAPQALEGERKAFMASLEAWRTARSSGDPARLLALYAPDFSSNGTPLVDWRAAVERDLKAQRGKELHLKDVSLLRWRDQADTMVVTFGEVAQGARSGKVRRQYWMRQGGQWLIFHEGTLR